jgi:hypothetical protein
VSTTKKALLPLIWRLNLLYCIVRGAIAGPATNLAPWREIDGDWSVLSLMRYLFSRGGRQQQRFFKVEPAKLAAFLGFTPPLPPDEARSKTSSPQP